MGAITLAALPEYLDRRGVRYELADGWLHRGRKSGGFEGIRGVGVHHSASAPSTALASAMAYCIDVAKDRPIGNGTISRDKDGPKLLIWCALASNTQGKGGPHLSSRGLIPLDAANSVVVSWEAENNGTGEAWPDDMCDLYVQVCAATIEWANENTPGVPLGAGDVMAHFEWAPGRKFDPAGPSRFGDGGLWDMDAFRGEVFAALMAGPAVEPPAPPAPQGGSVYVVRDGDGWWAASRALGVSLAEVQAFNGGPDRVLHPGDVLRSPHAPVPPPPPVGYPPGVPAPTLQVGDVGGDVPALQDVLRMWGWLPADSDDPQGTFGDWTWQGVINAQQALGVANQQGAWDAPTADAYVAFKGQMDELAARGMGCLLPAPSRPGDTGPEVVALQRFLASNAWYNAPLDGSYGPATTRAVQQLQQYGKRAGVDVGPIDGVFGERTRTAVCPLV